MRDILVERVRAQLVALPDVATWPAMVALLDDELGKSNRNWHLPVAACRAVGGDADAAWPGAAAILCLQIAIVLADDLMDGDERGVYRRLGYGPTSNLALAFQAAAFRVIESAPVSPERRADIVARLARMSLATARGQQLDVEDQSGEGQYWTIVRAKSSPFYGAAFEVGALLGQPNAFKQARELREVGLLFGELVQVFDDLMDAFEIPAKPDWTRSGSNLAILYGLTAAHADRARLLEIRTQIDRTALLEEAQQILIRCGAVGYCVYQLVERRRQALDMLDRLALPNPAPLRDVLDRQQRPLLDLFHAHGIVAPAELLAGLSMEPPA